MKFENFIVYLVIISVMLQPVAWAQDVPPQTPETPTPNGFQDPARVNDPRENDFYLHQQSWSDVTSTDIDLNENTFVAQHENAQHQTVRTVYKILSHGDNGVWIVNITARKKLHISLPATSVTFSKNYLFIGAKTQPQNQAQDQIPPGFFIIRLIDLHHYGSQTPPSPVPVYFLPIAPEMRGIKQTIVSHNDEREEERMTLIADDATQTMVNIPFSEIKEVLKIQMIYLALHQAASNPELSDLNTTVRTLQANFQQFYDDFYAELKAIGGENATHILTPRLRNLDWESSSAEELQAALNETEENPQLQALKARYAQRMAEIIDRFYTDFDSLMERTEFSFLTGSNSSQNASLSEVIPSSQESLSNEDQRVRANRLEEETSQAIKWYVGIGAATLFVFFGLPRLLGKPFSQLGADFTKFYYFRLTKPFTNFFRRRAGQEAQYVGMNVTADQFRRSFFQVFGDTATVVAAELMTRPLFRSMGEEGWENSILVNEPFTNIHSLWWQKNFLYNILSNQIIGTLGSTAGLALMEKEMNEIVRNFIIDTQIENIILTPNKPSGPLFSDAQLRQLADKMGDDVNQLKNSIVGRLRERVGTGATTPPLASSLITEAEMTALQHKWLENIREPLGPHFQIGKARELEIKQSFKTKILTIAQVHVNEQYQNMSRKVGILKKCFIAIENAVNWSMTQVLGRRATSFTTSLAKKSWNVWLGLLEPAAWNMLFIQTPIRGSFNVSMFLFNRGISLFFLCPFYISSYEAMKMRVGNKFGSRGELLYGIGYGIVTSFVYQYMFINAYEKPFLGTKYDLEAKKYYHHFFGDGRPLDDPELLRQKEEGQ